MHGKRGTALPPVTVGRGGNERRRCALTCPSDGG
jgi:hypothetical protein